MGNRRVKGTWVDALSWVRSTLAALGSPTASKGGNLAVASGSYGSKVQRAYQHIAFLDSEIAEFLRGEPYQAVIDPSPELHQVWPGALVNEHWFLRFHVLREPPAHWGPIIGECLYDFRSALDHAATILAGAEADTKTEFPIFWERAKYWARERSGQAARGSGLQKVDGMSHRVQAFIEHVQPHHRQNGDIATHPLWLLQDLTNQDKHQSPNLIGGAVVKGDLYVFDVPFKSFWFQTFEEGSEVHLFAKTIGPATNPLRDANTALTFGVAFAPTDTRRGLPVIETLVDIGNCVRGILDTLTALGLTPNPPRQHPPLLDVRSLLRRGLSRS